MTEAEWLACTDPRILLRERGCRASERKLRLLGVACCRSLWDLADDDQTRNVIDVAERYADGLANDDEALAAGQFMVDNELPADFFEQFWPDHAGLLCSAGRLCLPFDLADNLQGVLNNLEWRAAENAHFVHVVFGNPFRPVAVISSWLTPIVTGVAESIYQERAFERMPILADALEEADCNNQDILNQCRQGGEHVRGCWFVDLLLGKE